MRHFRLYADCLAVPGGLRKEEITRKVVADWMGHEDVFETEFPSANEDRTAYEAYWNITAERVLLRRLVLGHQVSQKLLDAEELKIARPFGPNAPAFSAFCRNGITMAMMCLPLARPQDPKKAAMARLYCVKGLKGRNAFRLPFPEGVDRSYDGYSWFLIDVGNDRPVDGRSWPLAARLLMRVVSSGNIELRKRLAKEYTATGRVSSGGHLHKVELLGKKFLAERPEFKNLKWIIPSKNILEAKGLSVLDGETFESVWAAFEAQLSDKTKDLIKTVRDGVELSELDHIGRLLRAGADANACDPESGRNARQFLMLNIRDKIVGLIKKFLAYEDADRKALTDADLIRAIYSELEPEWKAGKMCSYYGNKPLMFFQLARRAVETGDMDQLRAMADRYDINSTDRDGETVLDFAASMNDAAVESVISRLGKGAERRVYRLTSKKMRILLRDVLGASRGETESFLNKAFMQGLNPLELTKFTTVFNGKEYPCTRRVWDNLFGRERKGGYNPWTDAENSYVEVSYTHTSLLQEAILAFNPKDRRICRAQPLVEKCLEQLKNMPRVTPSPIGVKFGKNGYITTYQDLAYRFSSPAIAGLIRSAFSERKRNR